ncbi:hypothetical protein FHS39_001947 [Streptomyces olivoverticillatus]|uniref:Uncharacterized protein n=1 Tax=Streptomyces olivoverticillatus TaxID=66427 RepID=A0A7W7LNN4_9ACTN|nr:hypothetical protein [Streptomyces olivoverticillatus]MBB4892936.1 hypothetical protein [Streptomyces olivoverticillatus]
MSVQSRLAAVALLTAAAAAVVYPAASAFAADKDTRPGHPAGTVQQVQLPDGSRARLSSGSGGTTVTVSRHGKQQRTLDAAHPTADLDRLHLRIIDGNGTRPTLRVQLDGSGLTNYYDFASGSLRHTPDGDGTAKDHRKNLHRTPTTAQGAGAGTSRPAAAHAKPPHDSSGNPVKRVVEAGQVIKDRHDLLTPALAGGTALLLAGGGAYGVHVALRRNGRTDD